ncbi:MAG: S41 family peptidase [Proteiniphilum sp.]
MKQLLHILPFIATLIIVVLSCDPKETPDPSLGDVVSATYDATSQSFIVKYSKGSEKTYPAVIDNATTPPTASVALEDGRSIWTNNANITGEAFTADKETVNYVNEWIYDEMSIYYLWNNKLPQKPDYSLIPGKFFKSILHTFHPVTNPYGDRFSWIQENYKDLLDNLSGVSSSEIGFDYIFVRTNEAGTRYYALVLYPKSGTDAEAKGINRGRFITQVDGENITPDNYTSLFGGNGTKRLRMADWVYDSEEKSFYLQDSGEVAIQMHSRYAENPVHFNNVYTMDDKKVGYLVYNFFARDEGDNSNEYDKMLMSKLRDFQSQGINEMVLDLRYNSGGAVSSAIALASALVKDRSTNNVLVTSEYNSLVHNELKKEYGADYNKDYFIDKIMDTSEPIPSLNLSRLYVLTSGWTASASEYVINGLKPYMDVILIGETTYGKNVGSISIYEKDDPKNKWGMQPIIVRFANSRGESDFTAGFNPDYEVDEFEDLFLFDFGDTNDPLLGTALAHITGQPLRSALATSISTPFRSSQVDKRASIKLRDKRQRFEMVDDVRGEEIKNLFTLPDISRESHPE